MELVYEAWTATQPAHQFLSALLLSLITAGLIAAFRPKVKLIWGSTSLAVHKFKIDPQGEDIVIATEKLYVQNTGRGAASRVELVLNDIPSSYTLWPPREHVSRPLAGGGFSIQVPSLAPSELLIVDTIDIDRRALALVTVNCKDVVAQAVHFLPQREFGRLVTSVVAYLMFTGLLGSIYFALSLMFGD